MGEVREHQWGKRVLKYAEQSVGMFTQTPRIGIKLLTAKRRLDVHLGTVKAQT